MRKAPNYSLYPLRLARDRHGVTAIGAGFGGRFHSVPAFVGLGGIIKIGLINLFPGNVFPGVTGKLTHHRYHCALRHVMAAIERAAAANRSEKLVVLHLIRIALALPAPFGFAPNPAGLHRSLSLSAKDQAGIFV